MGFVPGSSGTYRLSWNLGSAQACFFRTKNTVPQVISAAKAKAVERRAYSSIKRQLAPAGLNTSKLRTHDRGADFTVTSVATGAELRVQLKASEAAHRVGFCATKEFWSYSADVLLFALYDPRPGYDPYGFYLFNLKKKSPPKCLKGKSTIRSTRQAFMSEFHNYRIRGLGPALSSLV